MSVCFIKAGADFLNTYLDAETDGVILDTMKYSNNCQPI